MSPTGRQTVAQVLLKELDDHMGARWEDAFRLHLRRLADRWHLGGEIVAIGPFWTAADGEQGQNEIDAIALAGRDRAAVLVGEAKWARRGNGRRIRPNPTYAVAAREEVVGDEELLRVTAADVFS